MSISVQNLSKSYKNVQALQNISFEVNEGELFGLIGPDGAGKTTLFRLLTTLLVPNEGNAKVAEYDILKNVKEIRNSVGYMPGKFSLYQDLTIAENLEFFATIFGTTVEENYDLIEDIYIQIEPFKNRRAGALSGGMKQKLALCCALIHKPKVLFLDEPTTGLDPGSRRVLWDEIKRLRDSGVTIILTTQYLEEADELADRIAIIDEGLVVAEGTSNELKASIGGDVVTLSFNSEKELTLAKELFPESVQEKNELRITVEDGASKIPSYINELTINSIDVSSVTASKPTLDDVFLNVTGYRLEGTSENVTQPPGDQKGN